MASNLYEELGLDANATTEEIRKAYKKKALKTHPDRLPPTATPEEKRASEERFRKVNNAYEILTDPEKRKEYDLHGVWPPPDEPLPGHGGGGGGHNFHHFDSPFDRSFSDPFFHHHHSSFRSFAFTDPFTLFDSIFNDFGPPRTSSFGYRQGSAFHDDPFERFARLERELADEFFGFGRSPFAMLGSRGPFGSMPSFPLLPDVPRGNGGGRWMSESYATQSINGVTRTIHKRRDWDGNEHVTQTLPDGREIYTINGVEQPRGSLPGNTEGRALPSPQGLGQESRHHHSLPPSPTNPGPPPPYPGVNGASYSTPHNPPPLTDQYSNMASVPVIPPPTSRESRRQRERNRERDRRHHSIHAHHRQTYPHPHSHYKYPTPPPPQHNGHMFEDKPADNHKHWWQWRG